MTPDPPFDMQQLLKQAQQMQQSLMAAQEELSQARIAGTSGGGLVTATVNGKGDLLALKIDPEALGPAGDPDAAETLADLVLAAVRDATGNASALASSTMGPLAEGLGGLGGGGLGGIGGSVPGLGL
jgi:DNA-binding YbaB/EbfC family protein